MVVYYGSKLSGLINDSFELFVYAVILKSLVQFFHQALGMEL